MKKLFLLIALVVGQMTQAMAQVVTDENGDKIQGLSIAIYTRLSKYNINGDMYEMTDLSELDRQLCTAAQMLPVHAAMVAGMTVVNRDEDAADMKKMLEEHKAEAYMDGITFRAKNLGASIILLQDIVMYLKDNRYGITETSYRWMSVETGLASHFSFLEEYDMTNLDEYREKVSANIHAQMDAVDEFFKNSYPNILVAMETKGKTVTVAPTRPFQAREGDVYHFFTYTNTKSTLQGDEVDYTIIEENATGSLSEVKDGLLVIKTDKAIGSIKENMVVTTADPTRVELKTYAHAPVAVMELPSRPETHEGFCSAMVNNAVYTELSKLRLVTLIENKELSLIKDEYELQKTEDYIDGAVINQYTRCGAKYVLSLSNFSCVGSIVSFTMKLISVEKNTVDKSFLVKCHVSNVADIVSYNLSLLFQIPVAVENATEKEASLLLQIPDDAEEGDEYDLNYVREIGNNFTGSTSYVRSTLANLKLKSVQGQRFVFAVKNISNAESYAELLLTSPNTRNLWIAKKVKEPSEKELMKDNTIERAVNKRIQKSAQKEVRKEKTKSLLKGIGKGLMEAGNQAMTSGANSQQSASRNTTTSSTNKSKVSLKGGLKSFMK